MVLASCDVLDLLAEEVLDEFWLEQILGRSVAKLPHHTIAERVKGSIQSDDH